jgi:hypothetical protein
MIHMRHVIATAPVAQRIVVIGAAYPRLEHR